MRRTLAWLGPLLILAGTLSAQQARDSYEIGPTDVLHVVVLGQDSMTGDFPVDQDGMLTFPILGKLKASQMTSREFERKLTTLLADGYLKHPQVSVSVAQYQSQKVLVTGEVQKPGPRALKGDRSLLALIADVGGFTSGAGHEVIVIRPPRGGTAAPPAPVAPLPSADQAPPSSETAAPGVEEPPVAGISLSDIPGGNVPGAEVFRVSRRDLEAGSPEANLLLKVGDTIYVPKAAQIYITGRVQRPGPYRYDEGMTVLQALTLAGGVTERGSSGRVKIVRMVDGQRVEVKAKMTDLVQPEDTIVVPERFF